METSNRGLRQDGEDATGAGVCLTDASDSCCVKAGAPQTNASYLVACILPAIVRV